MHNESHPTEIKNKISKLSANVTPDLLDQIDHLVKVNGPFAKRHSIHVAALRIGLTEITNNPNRLLEAIGHQG
jgi:hypothetical protein